MSNPTSTSDLKSVLQSKAQRVYIKDSMRTMPTSDGVMKIVALRSRKLFGNYKGGKYSKIQNGKSN